MTQLKLFLFGSPHLEQNDQALKVRGRKVLALAAYLAVNQQAEPQPCAPEQHPGAVQQHKVNRWQEDPLYSFNAEGLPMYHNARFLQKIEETAQQFGLIDAIDGIDRLSSMQGLGYDLVIALGKIEVQLFREVFPDVIRRLGSVSHCPPLLVNKLGYNQTTKQSFVKVSTCQDY